MSSLQSLTINDTGYLRLPVGTTAQRPVSPAVGYARFNTETNKKEYYNGTSWESLPPTPNVVTSSLQLYVDAGNATSYPGSGSTWFDLSGNSRNLTLYNTPTYSSADGGSIVFDGVNDYAKTTNNGIGTGSNIQHTIDMWVNFDVLTSTRWWLMVLGQYSTGGHHWIGVSPTATQFGVWGGALQLSPNLLGVSQWLHLVSVFNGTSLVMYVNNSSISTSGSGFNFTNSDFTIGLRIGAESYLDGKVSMVKLYNRALTAVEVEQNFNAHRERYGI